MAYRKKWSKRRKRPVGRNGGGIRRIGRYANMGLSSLEYARRAYSIAMWLKTIVNAEVKKVDIAISATPNASTGLVLHATAIAQGDTASSRDGNSVKLKYMKIACNTTMNASAATTVVRYLVIIDKQSQGADPTIADVLASANTTASLNQLNVGRFVILRDFTRVFSDSGDKINQYESVINFKYAHVRFDGTAGTDYIKGPIFFMAISDQATNTPTLSGAIRVGYYDN